MYKTKKKFGQHFLNDKEILARIVNSADLNDGDNVWEIGPGLGALTDFLLEKSINLSIYEIDNDLIPFLESKYSKKCNIIHSDILKINWTEHISKQKIKIVTNLPYQISSPFLYKVSENYKSFDCIVVMLQKEVAKRICANPGKKDYGVLTLKTRFYFDAYYLFDVTPDKFSPPPEVESAVIKLLPRRNILELENISFFWLLVESAFKSRRKTLRNNLRALKLIDSWDNLNCPINLNRRGETLSEEDFISLYKYLLQFTYC